jgi:hypothetical protein
MNTSAKALIKEINKSRFITICVNEDEHVLIIYAGLVYENAAHYIDIYAYHSNIIQTARKIKLKIMNAYEYEKEQLEQASAILTNENRF